jgi:hypothetical protein
VSLVQQMKGKDRGREAAFCAAWNEKQKVWEQKGDNLQEWKCHQEKPDINS